MPFLGPDGQPMVDLSKLKEEQAGPRLAGVRQIISGHPAQGLTPQRLAGLLREAEHGDPTRYLELAEEMEEKDLHYLAVLGTRKRSVSQLDITVVPASESAADVANAELVERFIDREELEDELVDILDAIGKGYSFTEIIWEMSERQWMPERLEWRDPRWFQFDTEDGRTPLLRTNEGTEPLLPFKFICHLSKTKSGLPIRGGLARAVAWGYLFKNYDIKDWISFIEVYGQPIRVGKYHPGASDEEKETLLRAVANIGTDAAAIIPTGMIMEFVESGQRRPSADLYKSFAEYIDLQISKAVLGQTLTTEVDGASLAAAKVHGGVKDDIERSDCKQLASTLNRDLVRPIVDLNNGPQQAYPLIRIGRPEEADAKFIVDAVNKLVPLGLRVGQREMRTKIGIGEPEPDDELLSPPRATPAPGEIALARAIDDDDSIDRVISEAIDNEAWVDPMQSIIEPLRELSRIAATFDEFIARIPEVITDEDLRPFAERLARNLFAARLAGEVGAPINDGEV